MSLEILGKLRPQRDRPLLCLEINPPRGTDLDGIFSRLEAGLTGVDFLNVTDSALARMKLAALPFGSILKQRYNIEPLVNFSCRDRNLIAIQSDLLAGWATGIRSVVALTGDAVTVGDMPDTKGVFEINSIGLLGLIGTLNSGKDMAGNDLKGAPKFISGVVVNPNARNRGAELRRLAKKKEAGACYALSQPVFDEQSSEIFFREALDVGVPIFMGLLPLKTVKAAKGVSKIPGIKMSDSLLALLEADPNQDVGEFFIEHCLNLARHNRDLVCGFHVVSGGTPKLALELCHELAGYIKSL